MNQPSFRAIVFSWKFAELGKQIARAHETSPVRPHWFSLARPRQIKGALLIIQIFAPGNWSEFASRDSATC